MIQNPTNKIKSKTTAPIDRPMISLRRESSSPLLSPCWLLLVELFVGMLVISGGIVITGAWVVGAAVSIISGGLRKVIRKYVYADLELREKLVNECEVIWYFGTSINGKIHPLPYYYTTLLVLTTFLLRQQRSQGTVSVRSLNEMIWLRAECWRLDSIYFRGPLSRDLYTNLWLESFKERFVLHSRCSYITISTCFFRDHLEQKIVAKIGNYIAYDILLSRQSMFKIKKTLVHL